MSLVIQSSSCYVRNLSCSCTTTIMSQRCLYHGCLHLTTYTESLYGLRHHVTILFICWLSTCYDIHGILMWSSCLNYIYQLCHPFNNVQLLLSFCNWSEVPTFRSNAHNLLADNPNVSGYIFLCYWLCLLWKYTNRSCHNHYFCPVILCFSFHGIFL
jgi:hypothetical protein